MLSGATGEVLRTIEAPDGALLFGFAVATGSSSSPLPGILVSAPATDRSGKKTAAGAVYHYEELDDVAPQLFQGKRRDQWFGISLSQGLSHLFVGSFEGHRKATKDRRGSVSVMLPSGKLRKTLRGKNGGDYFGRAVGGGSTIAVGVPVAAPLYVPE